MKYIKNFFNNFFLLFLDTEKLISIFVKNIPKEKFLEALKEFVEEEKRAKIGQIMHSISAQKFFIEKLENYEKTLDLNKKNEGDIVTIWDFTTATYVKKVSDDSYEQENSLCSLSDEEKNNFGKLMVYDAEYNGVIKLNENIALKQNLILSSINDNKLVAINSVHTRII
jgi:hypothetical protein